MRMTSRTSMDDIEKFIKENTGDPIEIEYYNNKWEEQMMIVNVNDEIIRLIRFLFEDGRIAELKEMKVRSMEPSEVD